MMKLPEVMCIMGEAIVDELAKSKKKNNLIFK